VQLVNDIFHSPVWNVIAAVAALIALWFIYRQLGLSRKDLRCELVATAEMFSIRDEMRSNIQILVDGQSVHDMSAVVLKIYNAGRIPILRTDYEQPIEISFGEHANIVRCGVAQRTPDNIETSLECHLNSITVAPSMLNSGDSIQIVVWLTGFSGAIYPVAHIIGIRRITVSSQIKRRARILYLIGGLQLLFYFLPLVLAMAALGLIRRGTIQANSTVIGSLFIAFLATLLWQWYESEDRNFQRDIRWDWRVNGMLWACSAVLVLIMVLIIR
jgi:hypothetical protein